MLVFQKPETKPPQVLQLNFTVFFSHIILCIKQIYLKVISVHVRDWGDGSSFKGTIALEENLNLVTNLVPEFGQEAQNHLMT